MIKTKDELLEWVTVQDCIGVPEFATTAPNVRKKLDMLAEASPELKRKRSGSKAFEYHVSLLPTRTQEFFGLSKPKDCSSPEALVDFVIETKNEHKAWWDIIFLSMKNDELERITMAFKEGGKKAIFSPDILSQDEYRSQSALNTAAMLDSLSPEARKEILAQYGISEQPGPVAPQKEPHKKAV